MYICMYMYNPHMSVQRSLRCTQGIHCKYIHLVYTHTCTYIYVYIKVKALDCQSKDHRFKSHQLPPEKKKKKKHLSFSTWHPTQARNPGPSKIVNWGPGLGWGRTRPLAVPNSSEVQVGLRVPTPQWRGIVSVPASAWPGRLQEFV